MHLAFSANAYTNYNVLEAIEFIATIGYEGIELLIDYPHIFLPLSEGRINKIKNQLLKNEISVSNLNVNTVLGWNIKKQLSNKFEPSLSNPDPKLRHWRLSYTKKAIDLASLLDSPSICITSGVLNKNNVVKESQYFKDSLVEIAEYAEKKNILVGLEYEPGLLVSNFDDALKFIKDFRILGLNFDTCHSSVLGENIPNIIEKYSHKLFHIHLSDCKDKIHYHLIPGKGEIDFLNMFQKLKCMDFDRFISIELYPYYQNPNQAAQETFNYLQKFLN